MKCSIAAAMLEFVGAVLGPTLGCLATGGLAAQAPVLAPVVDTTIVVGSTPLHYSAVMIPAGVTVRFVAPGIGPASIPGMPAIVRCDGDAVIDGVMSVGGLSLISASNTRAAGWVTTGAGLPGVYCGLSPGPMPQGGRHAGTYGSVIPFSLEGGSNGGDRDIYDQWCFQYQTTYVGGFGGGTLVLHAGGRIDVSGAVTADGAYIGSGGSGGSILLRGDQGVQVMPGGSVTARGGAYPIWEPPQTYGAPGYLRLDTYGAQPLVQGTVDPAPTVVELPHLRTQSPPQTGRSWILDVLAPENAPVFLAIALRPISATATPYGPLGIYLPMASTLAMTVPQPGHDPIAGVPLPVPAAPVLVGLGLWVQGLVVPPNLPPRLTNTLSAVVQ